jgi:hypothetical protein
MASAKLSSDQPAKLEWELLKALRRSCEDVHR